jgi:PBP1b-binding outer membrane lipoprotein LpoB
MKMKILALALGGLTLVLTGCVSTLDGKHEGGMPLVRDTVEGRYERPVDQVMKAAQDTISYNGVLTVHNVINNTLEGKVDKRTVWMKVEKLTDEMTKLTMPATAPSRAANVPAK